MDQTEEIAVNEQTLMLGKKASKIKYQHKGTAINAFVYSMIIVCMSCFVTFSMMNTNLDDSAILEHTNMSVLTKSLYNCNYTKGYWNRTTNYVNLGQFGTYSDHVNTEEWMQQDAIEAAKWDWMVNDTEECSLQSFHPEAFCQVLKNQNILFVGDSITHLHVNSLWHLMNSTGESYAQYLHGNTLLPTGELLIRKICGGKLKISYARSDLLTVGTDIFRKGTTVAVPWTVHLNEYAIIVLNAAAHFHAIPPYKTAIERVTTYLKENYNGTIVYRTSPRGHLGCKRDSKVIPTDTSLDASPYFSGSRKYNRYYSRFHEFNRIAPSHFKHLNNSIILDVARMTEYRPDSHLKPPKDCLHYILPGAIDQWNWLLFNALKGNLLRSIG